VLTLNMTSYSLMGVQVRVTWPIFKILGPSHIFGIGEARHFKFRIVIDTKEY